MNWEAVKLRIIDLLLFLFVVGVIAATLFDEVIGEWVLRKHRVEYVQTARHGVQRDIVPKEAMP